MLSLLHRHALKALRLLYLTCAPNHRFGQDMNRKIATSKQMVYAMNSKMKTVFNFKGIAICCQVDSSKAVKMHSGIRTRSRSFARAISAFHWILIGFNEKSTLALAAAPRYPITIKWQPAAGCHCR